MRVVIVEDEVLLRQGLALILEKGGIDVVALASDTAELESAVEALRPDLVIADIRLPPSYRDEGLEWALEARQRDPELAIVVLSQYVQRRYAVDLLRGSTRGIGYLLKRRIADTETFCADLHRVAAGGTALDPEVATMMVERARTLDEDVGRLTRRQREVLGLVAEGRSNAAIANALFLSEKAVVQHTSNIYRALGLDATSDEHRRVHAVLRYLEV
jgi:DNA-binding NarL/FixJ family response regulator